MGRCSIEFEGRCDVAFKSVFSLGTLRQNRANAQLVEAIWYGRSEKIRSLLAAAHLITPGQSPLALTKAHVVDPSVLVGFRCLLPAERHALLEAAGSRQCPRGLCLTAFEAAVAVRRDALAIELWKDARGNEDRSIALALEPLKWAMAVGSPGLLKELVRHVPRAQWAAAERSANELPESETPWHGWVLVSPPPSPHSRPGFR